MAIWRGAAMDTEAGGARLSCCCNKKALKALKLQALTAMKNEVAGLEGDAGHRARP
jgi:hypothetical protein